MVGTEVMPSAPVAAMRSADKKDNNVSMQVEQVEEYGKEICNLYYP